MVTIMGLELELGSLMCTIEITSLFHECREAQVPQNDKELNEQEVFHDAVMEAYMKSMELASEILDRCCQASVIIIIINRVQGWFQGRRMCLFLRPRYRAFASNRDVQRVIL